jgi:hypothetical protein
MASLRNFLNCWSLVFYFTVSEEKRQGIIVYPDIGEYLKLLKSFQPFQ